LDYTLELHVQHDIKRILLFKYLLYNLLSREKCILSNVFKMYYDRCNVVVFMRYEDSVKRKDEKMQ
jgi:hypothetical protein